MPVEEEAGPMLNLDRFSDFVMVTFKSINIQMFFILLATQSRNPQKDLRKEKNTVDGFSNWGIGVEKNEKYGRKGNIG